MVLSDGFICLFKAAKIIDTSGRQTEYLAHTEPSLDLTILLF